MEKKMNAKIVFKYYETEEGIPCREDQYEGSKNVRQWVLASNYDKLLEENQSLKFKLTNLRKVVRNIATGKVGDQLIMNSSRYASAQLSSLGITDISRKGSWEGYEDQDCF